MKHFLEIRDNDNVVSSCVLMIAELKSRKLATIEEVKTTEGYRNKGYGSLIIELAVAKAKASQCDTIELCYNPKDQIATKLYEKCGFQEDGNVRSKMILNPKWSEQKGRW